jgi:hypothetical protein
MSSSPQDPNLPFLTEFDADLELHQIVAKYPAPAVLAGVMRELAYRHLSLPTENSRYFLLALMDAIDWDLLARRALNAAVRSNKPRSAVDPPS